MKLSAMHSVRFELASLIHTSVNIMAGRLAVLLMCSLPNVSFAMCFDSLSGQSGYQIPLAQEISQAHAIVIVDVLAEYAHQDDQDDPYGVTAYSYTLKTKRQLRGQMPRQFVIRCENTSARYPMSPGEQHLLFVRHDQYGYWINPCGNSQARPWSMPLRHAFKLK